jgi:hypothetical protein
MSSCFQGWGRPTGGKQKLFGISKRGNIYLRGPGTYGRRIAS